MTVRFAGSGDAALLAALRLEFLGKSGGEESEPLALKIKEYIEKHIETGGFFAALAEEDGAAVSVAFLSVAERPPRFADSSNRVGTLYSVYTRPEYRRKGMAEAVVSKLLERAREQGIDSFDLMATKEGKYLYEKLGFETVDSHTAMKMKV